ncbi:hypothetical protein BOX15_Mlig029907g1 [Macrostomum lignano]|uniref:CUB domain-containing protein n=1 Tax=Macrostomum lignano TaxID=282301 RepID=A0A267E6Q9_9PLAT|nr:hypothetical protein BOX15_Mlig029907g1 [Macrostomum lignano]
MRLNLQMAIGRSLATLLLLSATFQIALAGNQYCYPRGNTNEFQLSLEFTEDRIIPETDADPVPEEGLNCKWKILTDHLDNSVVVLTGFDTEAHLSERRWKRAVDSAAQQQPMRYELHSKASSTSTCSSPSTSEPKPVELEMLRVLQLTKGSYLTVSFRLNPRSSANIPGLQIRLMEPGFCCRNITNFESNCYTTGSVRRNLTAELAAMRADSGVMRLASFSSSAALQNFVTESQRTRVGSGLSTRSKEPLSLAHWLRIGLFYEHRTKKVFYLNCGAEAGCKMAEFEDADKLYHVVETKNSSVSCGSLRAVNLTIDGDVLGLVSFTDCSEQLPALISFPDAAGNRCGNSSQPVLSWMLAAAQPAAEEEQTEGTKSKSKNRLSPSLEEMNVVGMVLLGAFATTLLAFIFTTTRLFVRRRQYLQYTAATVSSPVEKGGGFEKVCQSDSQKSLVRRASDVVAECSTKSTHVPIMDVVTPITLTKATART